MHKSFTPLLEVRRRSFGIIATRIQYPQTRHYVLRLGPVESRLILGHETRLSVGFLFTLLCGLSLR